jgi:protein-disulfide isomerase
MQKAFLLPIALALVVPFSLPGQSKQQEGITREQGDAILQELRLIRQALEKQNNQPAQPRAAGAESPVTFKLDNAVWLGNKNAPLTMVEFTDFQCPFCQRFHLSTFPEIRKRYIDTGKVRFASVDFPLQFHAHAFHAAEAARCAGEQGQFWKMRDQLVANPSRLSETDLEAHAREIGLKMDDFHSCLTSGKYSQAIEKDLADAQALNIDGTPSFLIGHSTPEGVNGVVLVGALPFAAFQAKFKELGAN